jgi:hypothetical protein
MCCAISQYLSRQFASKIGMLRHLSIACSNLGVLLNRCWRHGWIGESCEGDGAALVMCHVRKGAVCAAACKFACTHALCMKRCTLQHDVHWELRRGELCWIRRLSKWRKYSGRVVFCLHKCVRHTVNKNNFFWVAWLTQRVWVFEVESGSKGVLLHEWETFTSYLLQTQARANARPCMWHALQCDWDQRMILRNFFMCTRPNYNACYSMHGHGLCSSVPYVCVVCVCVYVRVCVCVCVCCRAVAGKFKASLEQNERGCSHTWCFLDMGCIMLYQLSWRIKMLFVCLLLSVNFSFYDFMFVFHFWGAHLRKMKEEFIRFFGMNDKMKKLTVIVQENLGAWSSLLTARRRNMFAASQPWKITFILAQRIEIAGQETCNSNLLCSIRVNSFPPTFRISILRIMLAELCMYTQDWVTKKSTQTEALTRKRNKDWQGKENKKYYFSKVCLPLEFLPVADENAEVQKESDEEDRTFRAMELPRQNEPVMYVKPEMNGSRLL